MALNPLLNSYGAVGYMFAALRTEKAERQTNNEIKKRSVYLQCLPVGVFDSALESILEAIQVCRAHSITAFFGVESIRNGFRVFHGGDVN